MKRSGWVAGLGVIAALGILGYAGWRELRNRDQQICTVCERPIHGNSRTLASLGGKPQPYCCPACALSERRQLGRPVEVLRLTDYNSGEAIAAADAYVVRGSSVSSCAHDAPGIGEDMRPLHATFDRCSPSMLAFADRAAAERFARDHGGEVLNFESLASEYR